MFKWQFAKNGFIPREGMKVIAIGRVSLYNRRGTYQFIVSKLEVAGMGKLYVRLQQLKKKLTAEGMFDPAHKQPLPQYPRTFGVVTSIHGKVMHDIWKSTVSHSPIIQLKLFPAAVQGAKAANDIARQIQHANDYSAHVCHLDTLIIARGGGSVEDLWPFNEPQVVHAIYNSQVPTVSAIGHSTDTTLSDYVSDVRATVPADAPNKAVPHNLNNIYDQLSQDRNSLINSFRALVSDLQHQLNKTRQSYIFQDPQRIYEPYIQEVDDLRHRLIAGVKVQISGAQYHLDTLKNQLQANSPRNLIDQTQQELALDKQKLISSMKAVLQNKSALLRNRLGALNALSPLRVMSRGYTFVSSHHRVIKSAKSLKANQIIDLNFHDGSADAKIMHVKHSGNTTK